MSTQEGSVVLTTPAQQWAYAVTAPLALPEGAAGPGVVRVRLHVEQGKLGVGVLAQGDGAPMLAEQAADASSETSEIDIELADVAKAGLLVLRSWSSDGTVTRARIFSIDTALELILPPTSAGSPSNGSR